MATIRASCPDCGDVELTTADLILRECADTGTGTYAFRCPHCRMMVVKPAESRTIDLLAASGVALTRWRLPAELHETHEGEPISHDDALNFHELLKDDDKFEQALHGLLG